jgi:hypothetical protein
MSRATLFAAAVLTVGTLSVWAWSPWRQSNPVGAAQCAAPVERVLARVGPIKITSADLERYSRYRRLSLGVAAPEELLQDLADRTLLVLAAQRDDVELTEVELRGELLRRQLLIAAGLPPTAARRPMSPFDRAASALTRSGFTRAEMKTEVRADVLALRVARRHPSRDALLADLRQTWTVEIPDTGALR